MIRKLQYCILHYELYYRSVKLITNLVLTIFIFNLLLILLYSVFTDKPILFSLTKPESMLIFATHQNDGVIQAGGTA